jgi:hypothetical protein
LRQQVLAKQIIPLDSSMHNPDGSTTIVGFRGQALTDEEGSGTTGDQLSLPCDQQLMQAAQSAAVQLDKGNGLPFWPGRDGPPVVHAGVVGSSDKWTQHRASIEALHHQYQTLCEEMECQVCARDVVQIHWLRRTLCVAHSTELSLSLIVAWHGLG